MGAQLRCWNEPDQLPYLIALLRHPDPLMTAALAANTPGHIRGIGAVFEVVSASCCQGIPRAPRTTLRRSEQVPRPDWRSIPSREPDCGTVGGRRCRPGAAAATQLWPLLCPGPPECSLLVTVGLTAQGAAVAGVPSRRCAVRLGHRTNQLDWWLRERQEWWGRIRGADGRQRWIKAVDLRPVSGSGL